jgi:ribosome modulation factor
MTFRLAHRLEEAIPHDCESFIAGDMQADVSAHRIFVPPKRALAVLGGPAGSMRRRKRDLLWQSAGHGYQGIVCECCYNHCDVTELTQYCANGGQLTRIGRRATHRGYYP